MKELRLLIQKMVPSAKIIISSPGLRVDKANSDINNKKFISLLNSADWDCIHHENIDESHLNWYGLHIDRTGSISWTKNLISGIQKFWYDLDSKINKKKFSPALSVRNSDQLELDFSFKSYSVKSLVEQPDDDMLGLRKLRIKNPNKIIIAHLNINSLRNKFEMLSLLFHGVIDILMICENKIDDSFPTKHFIIEGYSTIYRLDRNDRGGGMMLIVKDNLFYLPFR